MSAVEFSFTSKFHFLKLYVTHTCTHRYEEITSKKLLGKRKRSSVVEGELVDVNFEVGQANLVEKGRHKQLQKRLDKMDKKGFLKPS